MLERLGPRHGVRIVRIVRYCSICSEVRIVRFVRVVHWEGLCLKLKGYALTRAGRCVICGEARLACLSIDHIDGGGTTHKSNFELGGVHFTSG